MFEFQKDISKPIQCYLVGIRRPNETSREASDHLEELAELVDTMGLPVAGKEMVHLHGFSQKYFVGSGKAEEIKGAAAMAEAQLIIIDDDLTPAQQRNWEKLTENAVIDRREVILDIFRQRARTREARVQVELARLEYSLPRLKRAWTHLERQRGGGGFTGGAGEAQIEVDRRMVRDAISRLKKELVDVRRQRATQRSKRQGKPVPTAAIIGYTNAGKSSILNTLTDAGVLAENRLFATLDPTTRRLELPNNQELLLTDTVGFIRKLPTMLVEAFMATLEESQLADFLVHVVDAAHPAVLDHLAATEAVLAELKIVGRPVLYVLNKADPVTDEMAFAALKQKATPHVITSVLTGQGMEELRMELSDFAGQGLHTLRLRIPPSRFDLISLLHREGHVISEEYDDDHAVIEVDLAEKFHHRVLEWSVEN